MGSKERSIQYFLTCPPQFGDKTQGGNKQIGGRPVLSQGRKLWQARLSDGGAMVDPGGRALVGWFHDEATNGQSGPSCPHCRSNHLFNDQTPDKKLSLNTFLSNLIGTVHKLHNRRQGWV